MVKRYESQKKPKTCPKCGAEVYYILYGFPAMSPEQLYEKYHVHVALGGCCISEDDPTWECSQCGTKIYKSYKS